MKTILIVHKQVSLFQLTKIYKDTDTVQYKFFPFTGDSSKLKDIEFDEMLYFNTKDICPQPLKEALEVKLEEKAKEPEEIVVKEEKVDPPKPKRTRHKKATLKSKPETEG